MFAILHINLGQDVTKFFPKKTKFYKYLTVSMWIIF